MGHGVYVTNIIAVHTAQVKKKTVKSLPSQVDLLGGVEY